MRSSSRSSDGDLARGPAKYSRRPIVFPRRVEALLLVRSGANLGRCVAPFTDVGSTDFAFQD